MIKFFRPGDRASDVDHTVYGAILLAGALFGGVVAALIPGWPTFSDGALAVVVMSVVIDAALLLIRYGLPR